ncbi:MAG: multicopper oxidase domain-containing protein, partial [Myxococcales bacterium]|nr:multicopper oxidase domain-containing protein [Myxococcales bacterium]
LVPTGATRVVEFVADALGDWAMHCHMTHHIMNQMGHDTAVMVGADGKRLNKSLRRSGTKLMPMGTGGMGGMAEMKMPVPTNSIPMHGGQGPFSYIDMGGMFTILKVREHPEQEDGSGWYKHPDGSVADVASEDDLRADGIDTKG